MSEIFAARIPDEIRQVHYDKFNHMISQERRIRNQRFYQDADRKRSLFAEILLRYALKLNYGIEDDQVQFEYNSFGKPMLKHFKDIKYNLSHSGSWVLCGFSSDEIGVDVELIAHAPMDIAKHFFAKQEYINILSRPKEEQARWFYVFWTLKESYIKAEGKGLSISLSSFGFEIFSNQIVLRSANHQKNDYYFRTFYLDSLHIGALCSRDMLQGEVKIISYENLLQL